MPAAGRPIPHPSKEAPFEPRFAQRIKRTASQMNKQTHVHTPAIHAIGTSAFILVKPLSLTSRRHRGTRGDLQCHRRILFWTRTPRQRESLATNVSSRRLAPALFESGAENQPCKARDC